ncbi:MAG: DNA repair protein, partial [Bacilli bacterium]
MNKTYICIDLKTFFASVECVLRGLDPFETNLVVADPDRQTGTLCLAISPKMKAQGIKNRCRIYEIPKEIKYIMAKPRMSKYIEYSSQIYSIYLRFISSSDIHVYSIDEVFIDATNYLALYKLDAISLAKKLINEVYKETGITAAAG